MAGLAHNLLTGLSLEIWSFIKSGLQSLWITFSLDSSQNVLQHALKPRAKRNVPVNRLLSDSSRLLLRCVRWSNLSQKEFQIQPILVEMACLQLQYSTDNLNEHRDQQLKLSLLARKRLLQAITCWPDSPLANGKHRPRYGWLRWYKALLRLKAISNNLIH